MKTNTVSDHIITTLIQNEVQLKNEVSAYSFEQLRLRGEIMNKDQELATLRAKQADYDRLRDNYSALVAEAEAENSTLRATNADLLGWLKKASQMAKQEFDGVDDAPMWTAWRWLYENADEAIAKAEREGSK